ncbi:PepSY-associated TM helix domain-containing protein [uncultured Paludibaculum sp.]|uniref:PepSY-associated TM helix domain-containing protein n=1 Tax=uncultured Paludibaculum sp. TaxID=1765020 RepID=UPI002AAAD5A2|nr:PepSY-associated TM helix domain-containing protein [uncultured Paludibaculum sp.]
MRQWLRRYIERPQELWLRKAMFQIHLWLGLLLVVYVVMIGVSGSILVLRSEFQQWTGLNPVLPAIQSNGRPDIGFAGAVASVRRQYPKARIGLVYPPRKENPGYFALISSGRDRLLVTVHPHGGEILRADPPTPNWLTWIGQMHYFLLMGRTGFVVNGIASALLIAMSLSGLFLWWPGIRRWITAVRLDFGLGWKRINWDLHNVTGFWTLGIVLIWAVSGVYLVWPREFTAVVNRFSRVSLEGAREGRIRVAENKKLEVRELARIVAEAPGRIPGSHVGAISFPTTPTAPLQLYMVRNGRESLSGADFVYYEPSTGAHLKTSLRNDPKTFGDWIIWLMRPLHFGTHWGMAVKVIWFALGLSLPLLGITGVIMYWNRYLSRQWNRLKRRGTNTGRVAASRPSEQRY